MDKTLVIMAAGMGTRYGGLKQLDAVGPSGETIFEYSVFDAIRAGFNKVVFIIRRDFAAEFKSMIGTRFEDRIEVRFVFQELSDIPERFKVPKERNKPWGTGHAMLTAQSEVNEPFIVINADDFYGADAFVKSAGYLDKITPGELSAALVGFFLKNTLSDHGSVARGICKADEYGVLLDVEEILGIERREDGTLTADNREGLIDEDLVSMNMWAFSPEIFGYTQTCFSSFLEENIQNYRSEFYIPLIVSALIKQENLAVQALETNSQWYGVTYQEDKPEVVANLARMAGAGEYPINLWEKS